MSATDKDFDDFLQVIYKLASGSENEDIRNDQNKKFIALHTELTRGNDAYKKAFNQLSSLVNTPAFGKIEDAFSEAEQLQGRGEAWKAFKMATAAVVTNVPLMIRTHNCERQIERAFMESYNP